MDNKRKAILVVSFGTSYSETRKKTIEQIEKEIGNAFPEYALYRAWTSGMIRKKLLKRDGIFIADVRGAMEQMKAINQAAAQRMAALSSFWYGKTDILHFQDLII